MRKKNCQCEKLKRVCVENLHSEAGSCPGLIKTRIDEISSAFPSRVPGDFNFFFNFVTSFSLSVVIPTEIRLKLEDFCHQYTLL